jgi:hypothetical protein
MCDRTVELSAGRSTLSSHESHSTIARIGSCYARTYTARQATVGSRFIVTISTEMKHRCLTRVNCDSLQ